MKFQLKKYLWGPIYIDNSVDKNSKYNTATNQWPAADRQMIVPQLAVHLEDLYWIAWPSAGNPPIQS